MKVSSVVAGWIEGICDNYRNSEEGIRCLEAVVQYNLDSDFILFPGAFVSEKKNGNGVKSQIEKISKSYEGVLIAGISKHDERLGNVLIAQNGQGYLFEQTCMSTKDCVYRFDPKDRFFYHKKVIVGVISCGELFNHEFRKIMFDYKSPDLIFGCVHKGVGLSNKGSFPNEPYRTRLNQNSNRASFYTYHTNNIEESNLRESNFSGVPIKDIQKHDDLNLSVIKYEFNSNKKYEIKVTRKIKKID